MDFMMKNTTTVATLRRATFGRFTLAQYTRTVYSFDSVETECAGIEYYTTIDGVETFHGYVDTTSVMGEIFAEAIAAAPVHVVRRW